MSLLRLIDDSIDLLALLHVLLACIWLRLLDNLHICITHGSSGALNKVVSACAAVNFVKSIY